MSDIAKPKWRCIADHPDWRWVADAPEAEATAAWRRNIEAKYGQENVATGPASSQGPNCPFALYVHRSALA